MKKFFAVLLVALVMCGTAGFFPGISAEAAFADGYNGSTYVGAETETISYATKTDEEIFIDGGLPKYCDVDPDLKNTCANVAGAITLGYFDKDYNELIPNFTAVRVIKDKILYATQTSAVQDVIASLYDKMQTNTLGNGTTVEQFKSGLTQYVNEQGRNITFSQVVNDRQVNFSAYKNAINEKKPVVFFVSKYTMQAIDDLKQDDNTDVLHKLYYSGDHMVVGYGIREISYYNADGSLKKQLTFLRVATGYSDDALAYVLLDDRITVVDGYKVNIF